MDWKAIIDFIEKYAEGLSRYVGWFFGETSVADDSDDRSSIPTVGQLVAYSAFCLAGGLFLYFALPSGKIPSLLTVATGTMTKAFGLAVSFGIVFAVLSAGTAARPFSPTLAAVLKVIPIAFLLSVFASIVSRYFFQAASNDYCLAFRTSELIVTLVTTTLIATQLPRALRQQGPFSLARIRLATGLVAGVYLATGLLTILARLGPQGCQA